MLPFLRISLPHTTLIFFLRDLFLCTFTTTLHHHKHTSCRVYSALTSTPERDTALRAHLAAASACCELESQHSSDRHRLGGLLAQVEQRQLLSWLPPPVLAAVLQPQGGQGSQVCVTHACVHVCLQALLCVSHLAASTFMLAPGVSHMFC